MQQENGQEVLVYGPPTILQVIDAEIAEIERSPLMSEQRGEVAAKFLRRAMAHAIEGRPELAQRVRVAGINIQNGTGEDQ